MSVLQSAVANISGFLGMNVCSMLVMLRGSSPSCKEQQARIRRQLG
jgi:hypothetical protein